MIVKGYSRQKPLAICWQEGAWGELFCGSHWCTPGFEDWLPIMTSALTRMTMNPRLRDTYCCTLRTELNRTDLETSNPGNICSIPSIRFCKPFVSLAWQRNR